MSRAIHIVNTYPHRIEKVWAALTDPTLVPLWTTTGRGGRLVGFEPTVGNRFRFVGTPFPGWNGVVHCEVLEVEGPHLLRYSWANQPDDDPTYLSYRLIATAGGTTFTYDHTGFHGPGGLFMSALLGRVRRKMLTQGLPLVLDDLTDTGALRPDSKFQLQQL